MGKIYQENNKQNKAEMWYINVIKNVTSESGKIPRIMRDVTQILAIHF